MRGGKSGQGGEGKLGRKEEDGLQVVMPQEEQQPSMQQLEKLASQ
jgi:hypothetical protein